MDTLEPIDISILPDHAQHELHDFYLFLKQRYVRQETTEQPQTKNNALTQFVENNKKRNLKVSPDIDLTALADQVNDMDK